MISSMSTISFAAAKPVHSRKKSDSSRKVTIAEGVTVSAVGVVKGEKIFSRISRGITGLIKGTGTVAQKGTMLQPTILKYFKNSKFKFLNNVAKNKGMQCLGKWFVGGTALAVVGADIDNIGKNIFGSEHKD